VHGDNKKQNNFQSISLLFLNALQIIYSLIAGKGKRNKRWYVSEKITFVPHNAPLQNTQLLHV
jgi:hypothetical protein